MAQEIRVVKCFKCEIYQTDIVKKAKKWQCKLCGEKQSVQYEFGRGTGQECRLISQKLNDKRMNNDVLEFSLYGNLLKDENHPDSSQGPRGFSVKDVYSSYIHSTQNLNETGRNQDNTGTENKWSKFVETTNDNSSDDGNFHESSSSKFQSHSFYQDSNVSTKSFKRSLENVDDDDDNNSRTTKIYKRNISIKGEQNERNISYVSLLTNQLEENKKANNTSKWSKWIDKSNDYSY